MFDFKFGLKFNKIITIALIFLMLVLFVFGSLKLYAYAEDEAPKTGHLTSDSVNIRIGPGTEFDCSPSNPYVNSSTEYEILGSEEGTDGHIWYKIKITKDEIAYVRDDLFEINVVYNEDGDFEEYLTSQGFPDSYKDSLRSLHEQFPTWVFVAAQTGIDWSTAVAAESNPANLRKVVYPSQPETWRSVEKYAYDLDSGEYIKKYDGGTFYAASKRIVSYYMDPRNFLNKENIFQFLQLSYNSTAQTKEGLQAMLDGTFMEGDLPDSEKVKHSGKYATYNDVIMAAAKKSSVSPYEIASIILQEQGVNGTGGDITDSNEYFNFFNIGASGADAITKGLEYAKKHDWTSYYKSIVGGAQWYYKEYISSGQDTKYFTNWNVNMGMSALASYQYATYVGDTASKTGFLFESYEDHLDYPLVFKIPVFKNMPKSKCKMPGAGNDINFLKSLTVGEFELTEDFDPYTSNYELVLDPSVTSIKVKAKAYAGEISGTGTINVEGEAGTTIKVTIKVKASSGVTRKYYITVAKAKGGQKGSVVTPDDIKYDKYISGINENLKYSSFMKLLTIPEGGDATIYDTKKEEVTSGKIGTGMRVVITDVDSNVLYDLKVVIRGDLDGDSTISVSDLISIRKHLVGLSKLKNAYLEAADLNKDGSCDTQDLILMRKVLVGLEKIKQ